MKIATLRQLFAEESPIALDGQGKHEAATRCKNVATKNGCPVIASMAALLLLSIGSESAVAQPANDTFSGATEAFLNFSQTLDTTEASTDEVDSKLNEICGFQATDASVWYLYTSPFEMYVKVDVSLSNYSTGIIVGVGDPSSLDVLACEFSSSVFRAVQDEPYYVLVFDPQYDEGGNGGLLDINFSEALPTVLDNFTVNSNGYLNKRTGIVTISGSYTCSNGDYFWMYLNGSQSVGRFIISANGNYIYEDNTCDQEPHPWTSELKPYNGKFAGGKFNVEGGIYVCGRFNCDSVNFEQVVQLRNGSKK